MSKGWCITGFVTLGIISVVNLVFLIRDHTVTADPVGDLTPFAPTQNNLYPNGKITNVGTKMASQNIDTTPSPSANWEAGGSSVITNSTGTWAA